MDTMKRAIYAGSFDLPTIGHEWVIEQGRRMFDHLIVGIGINPNKKYTFTMGERALMMEQITLRFENVDIVLMENKLLKDFAEEYKADYLLRGVRSAKDFQEEMELRDYNSKVTTCFLIPPPEIRNVSSSFVKGLIGYVGWEQEIEPYVPVKVYKRVVEKYKYELKQ